MLCSILTGKKDANYSTNHGKYAFFTCAKVPLRCDGYSFEGEAILLAGNGDIGNISHYDGRFEAYQRTYVLQATHSVFLKFLYYCFLNNWVSYNRKKTYGGAIPFIRLGNIEEYLVVLPPIQEQHRIVKKLESLLACIPL